MKKENEKIRENIARILKETRKKNKLNQADIANLLGMSQSNYSKVERNALEISATAWAVFCISFDLELDSLIPE